MKKLIYIPIVFTVWTHCASAQSGVCFNSKVIFEGANGGLYPDTLIGKEVNSPTIVLADFNNDAITDSAVANHYDHNVSVFLGDGTGNFSDAGDFEVASYPNLILAADFNGDNNADLVTLNYNWGSSEVSMLTGNGAGSFAPTTNYPAGPVSTGGKLSMAAYDFNIDGWSDLVIPKLEQSNASLTILLSNDLHSFVDTLNFTLGQLDNVSDIKVSDFNGDDFVDLVVATESWGFFGDDRTLLFILLGNCAGGFSDPVMFHSFFGTSDFLIPGDYNSDGFMDLVYKSYGSLTRLFGNGDGTFWLPRNSASFATGDLNADGHVDLATAYYANPNEVSVFYGNGEGGLHGRLTLKVGNQPEGLIAVELNGDENIDLVSANKGSNDVSVLLGKGVGSFSEAVNYAVGLQPSAVTSDDFNGDGMADLATVNTDDNSISVLQGNGSGSFASAVNYPVGGKPIAVVSGDFNGDGKADLAVANASDRNVSILLNNNAGGFENTVSYSSGWGSPSSIACADFDNNGTLDLVVGNAGFWDETLNFFTILAGDGSGGYEVVVQREVEYSSTTMGITCADFNGDGLMDISVSNHVTSVFLNGINFNFGAPITFSTNGNAISTADFNGDNKPDLAIIGTDLSVLLNYNFAIMAEGPTTFCAGESVTLKTNLHHGIFNWSSGDTTVDSVVITTAGTYHAINTHNGCSLKSNDIKISVNPPPDQPAQFTNSTENICAGSVSHYRVPLDSLVTYTWKYEGTGATILEEGNAASINFDENATSGIVAVTANNSCGVSRPRTLGINVSTIPEQPEAFIESLSIVCQGQSHVSYRVPLDSNVTYTWSYSGTGGVVDGNSNSVLVTYSDEATNGNISVIGANACGHSTPMTMAIVVNSMPPKPTISSNELNTEVPKLISSNTNGNQWFLDDVALAGETNDTLYVNTPGAYSLVVTLDGCASELSDTFSFAIMGTEPPFETEEMIVFPNPAASQITIGFREVTAEMNVSLVIYDQMGRLIKTFDGIGGQMLTIPISDYSTGNYFIQAKLGKKIMRKRFVKK